MLAQDRQKRRAGFRNGVPTAVDGEGDVIAGLCRQGVQLNDWPQPQVRCALGLSIEKPAFWRLSL